MNRIKQAIALRQAQIDEKVAKREITPEKLVELSSAMDMQLDEFVAFQELKSLAFAEGRLTYDEATYVFTLLGNTPEQFNKQSLPVKLVLTQLLSELLNQRIAA